MQQQNAVLLQFCQQTFDFHFNLKYYPFIICLIVRLPAFKLK